MASRFYMCICGRFATIDMLAWITGDQRIECQCGRQLKNNSVLGFNLDTAACAWNRYMKKELLSQQGNQ